VNDLNVKMDALIKEVRRNPDGKKRMYSKTFWGQLKIERRLTQRVADVKQYLEDQGITISTVKNNFGSEEPTDWITLQHWDISYPPDAWFADMSNKVYDNEHEVNVFFLTPLFTALGYQEEDFTFEYKIDIADKATGRRSRKKAVDLALFDGTDRADANLLVICEAKMPDKPNSRPRMKNLKTAENDLKYYKMGASTAKRFVATNGDIVKVFTAGENDLVERFKVHRSVFKDHWPGLYLNLGKPILVKELKG